jgi:ATP-dependent RNA helicase DDX35
MSIRKQLKKYLERFNIPIKSCEGDGKRLRRCLVSGYFKVGPIAYVSLDQTDSPQNAARMMPDGTYRSAREGAVSHPSNGTMLDAEKGCV